MTAAEILDQIRSLYVDALESEIEERSGAGVSVVSEAAYLTAEGELSRDGEFNLPARADVIVVRSGRAEEALQVDTERMISFSPVTFVWEETLEVTVEPFQWNWCEIELRSMRK